MRLALAAFLLVAFVFPCSASAGTTGSLAGYVVDSEGHAIAEARIVIESPAQRITTTTDARGYYVALNLSPGEYTVTAMHRWYGTVHRNAVPVTADEKTILRIEMLPAVIVSVRDYHDPFNLINEFIPSDAYGISEYRADVLGVRSNGAEIRFAPGVIVPILAPKRGMP